jgi:enoyl reductase
VSDANAFADMAERYGKGGFNKGKDGSWWELKVPDLSRAGECAALDDWAWITPGEPPADVPAIDPEREPAKEG